MEKYNQQWGETNNQKQESDDMGCMKTCLVFREKKNLKNLEK